MTATAALARTRSHHGRQLAAFLQLLRGVQPVGRLLEIRYTIGDNDMGRLFVPARRADIAERTIATLAPRGDVYCGVLLRHRYAGSRDAVAPSHLTWVEIDQPDSLERLADFPYAPTMTVHSGTLGHAHAYWQLNAPVDLDELEQANRCLAHHLGADPASTDAARVLRPCGTLNHKHQPPAPVTLAAHRPARTYALADLLHDLAQPPAPRPVADDSGDARRRVTELDQQLLAIPAATYVRELTQQEPGRNGKITCPFHDDHTPSLHLYDDGTWYCFGCQTGGSIYDFAAALWHTHTKGREFLKLRKRLHEELHRLLRSDHRV